MCLSTFICLRQNLTHLKLASDCVAQGDPPGFILYILGLLGCATISSIVLRIAPLVHARQLPPSYSRACFVVAAFFFLKYMAYLLICVGVWSASMSSVPCMYVCMFVCLFVNH